MSEKGPLFRPTFAFPMVSVCVLAGAFLVYYFPVREQQGGRLNQRAFRSLAAVSDSLASRVVNYVDVLEQISKRTDIRVDSPRVESGQGGQFEVRRIDDSACTSGSVQVDTQLTVGSYRVQLQCGGWVGTVGIDRILAPLLRDAPQQLFDDIVLADGEGSVLFQLSTTGSRIANVASFLAPPASTTQPDNKAPAPTRPALSTTTLSSSLVTVSLADEPYRVYLVPVRLKVPAAKPAASALVLAGLMRQTRFNAASMAVPGTVLVSAVLIALVLLVATWPLLKFATCGVTDRLSPRSAIYLFLSTLGTIILVCMLAIHIRYVTDLRAVDLNLTRLATSIERNLDDELKLALRVINSANASRMLQDALTFNADCRIAASDSATVRHVERDVLARHGVQLADYPYFDRIFWTDNDGNQHVKWEAARPTPATRVADRSYFIDTAAGRLWQLADARPGAPRFRVDPVYSKNTGEYRAVISEQVSHTPVCDGREVRAVSMVTPLLSLIDPVMPPDYGFAVLDQSGTVLFHSTSAKNGQEHFLDELADGAAVRSALLAHQRTVLTARYLGVDQRMFVSPITSLQQSPWSIVVFHNLTDRASQHFERMILFGSLAFTYFAVLAAVLLVLPVSRGPRAWMWPRTERRGSYIHLALTLVLIAIPLYLLLFELSRPVSVLRLAWLIPLMLFAAAALKLASTRRLLTTSALGLLILCLLAILLFDQGVTRHLWPPFIIIVSALLLLSMENVSDWLGGFRWPSLSVSYTMAWASLLTVTALLPCIGFFRLAYDYHGNLATRRQQIQVMASLAEREDRVKQLYDDVALTDTTNRESSDIAHWLFVRRRLDQTLDRYDAALLLADAGQLFTPKTSLSGLAALRTAVTPDDCDDGLSPYVGAFAPAGMFGDAALARVLTTAMTDQPAWHWCREGLNRLRIIGRSYGPDVDRIALSLPPTRALLKSATGDPVFLHPELVSELPVLQRWPVPAALAILSALGLLLFCWLKPTLEQLFLLTALSPTPLPVRALTETTPIAENLILLAVDQSRAGRILRQRKDVHVIDVVTVLAGTEPQYKWIEEPVVALEHFDYGNDDATANGKKLAVLERMATLCPDKRVVIVAAVDPQFFFDPGSSLAARPSLEALAPGGDADRWWNALARFTRVRVDETLPDAPSRGRLVWSTCTTAERVALHQMAHDGWVNPKNEAALEHLQLRGLIHGRPFRFADAALKDFVSRSISRDDRQAWVKQEPASLWDGIRQVFVVLLIGVVAAALFFSQQSVLGLVATGLGILTPLTRLLSEANSLRGLVGFGKPK